MIGPRAARARPVKAAFHDTDILADIRARILADTSDTCDFLKLFLWPGIQAEKERSEFSACNS